MGWIKGKQTDPTMRPRIDWWATWRPFMPFWIAVAILATAFYVVRPMFASASQEGVASVYSGGLTANGEHARPTGLTAAHRSLPFGTLVRVTTERSHRSVIVRINDRGPFVRGRIIDLMPAAARALGMDGLAKVTVEIIGRVGHGRA
jgi:rare lipoprotein A